MSFLRRFDVVALTVLLLWLLTLLATPIARQMAGEKGLFLTIQLGVMTQAAAVLTVLGRGAGWRSALLTALPVLPLAWLAEFLGSQTGFPFGRYHYTDLLRPQLGGVPLLIPLAWLMMLFPARAVAERIIPLQRGRLPVRFLRAIAAAMAFTAWDLFLDPQMVTWGIWVWEEPGAYFGIPFINFLGWFLVSFLFSLLLSPSPLSPLTSNFLLLIYALTWFLQTVAQLVFWNLRGPALFGFLGMGGMLLWAFLRRTHAANAA